MKSVYKYYKERLVEISGRNRSLYSKKISKSFSYDIGKILDADYDEIEKFLDFLWKGRRSGYTIICKNFKDRIYKNLNIDEKVKAQYIDTASLLVEDIRNENLRRERVKKEETKKAIVNEVNSLRYLKREIEEFAKETGRYELFIGYPFVEGSIGKDMVVKAPLLLFPATINIDGDSTAELELKKDEPIQLNKVFVLAYAKENKLNIEDIILEFDDLMDSKLKDIDSVLFYLKKFGFKLSHPDRKGMFNFERGKEPKSGDELSVRHYCVIGRFPLANSIYNDYSVLEKNKLTSDAIDELLLSKKNSLIKNPQTEVYTINDLDYAQEHAIVKQNESGNIVIYGPPGTGKSQTIVNIVADSICKNKKVLVVSQKKAALDVVFNRLGALNEKAMFVPDPEKDKSDFYEKIKNAHFDAAKAKQTDIADKYFEIENKLNKEINDLSTISKTLYTKLPFGLTLQEMYAKSYMIGKNSFEYELYREMLKNNGFMKLNYASLNEALTIIDQKRKAELYYKNIEMQKTNPLISYIKSDIDMHLLNTSCTFLNKLITERITPFDIGKYPNARQLVAFYLENNIEEGKNLRPLINLIAKIENPTLNKMLKASYVLFPMYPFTKVKMIRKQKEIEANFEKALTAIREYIKEYSLLKNVLNNKGYAMTVDNILNGNTLFLKLLLNALNNYVEIRDMNLALEKLSETERLILDFAYKNSSSLKSFKEVLSKLMIIRIYHEVVLAEESNKANLSLILSYENIRSRIINLKQEEKQVTKQLAMQKFIDEYKTVFNKDKENKNFLYQITKQQSLWPIRKMMETYGDYLLNLFPCWLLSPESVSTIMPLKKNMFDLILFDEASQIFIESTLPTIYRGKHIAVAGDAKQLRPTATFMKRYMGNDDTDLDLSTQAALEVESLLDLATSRYASTNLTYHYRSKNEELIDFSNHAFYEGKLQIAPNITKNLNKAPIERIKVNGKWINRHNEEEAVAVVALLSKLFKTRKNKETIGIITFNSEQEQFIEDLIDKECTRDEKFAASFLKESNRKENGEDKSIFIKNLENVQGDERDIIIFCIGYAKNEYNKVVAHFGPLSIEGGENRLNVAITRAKEKIYVVTSIEPEELNVETTKNLGPKIFKKYLQYVRAVSKGNSKEASIILENLKDVKKNETEVNRFENEIKDELVKLGYTVETNLGNTDYKISLAIYDKQLDKYLIGIECDYAAYYSSDSLLERDVYRPKFLISRGWNLIRIWSRDWWLNKAKVIDRIVKLTEKAKEKESK